MPILLVEDDHDLAAGLRKALRNAGLPVNHVATGREALAAIAAERPDIVVLDIGLPDMDGLAVLKRIRADHDDLPVLLLTARATLQDKVAGLDLGADDYLPKPFDMDELLARLRVLQRRLGTARASSISIGEVDLNTTTQELNVNGTQVDLGRREFMLLKALMENAGRVQTRDALETGLYSWGEEIASNAIEVHIHHLRRKLPQDFIKTVRGVGYIVKT
jgi:DNA-binding response OmpR family regulator